METVERMDAVAGVFRDEQSAKSAVAMMIDDGAERGAISVLRAEDDEGTETGARRGVVTGALVGTATGVALEGTVLAFPPAAIFLAGGTLAAAAAGLAIGSSTGAVAGAVLGRGLGAVSAGGRSTRARGRRRVVVTFSSPDLKARARARLRMRVGGAIETNDPSDDDTGPVFVPGFATVVPRLRADLRGREGSDRRWDEVELRYRYGWQLANRPDMEERSWSDASREVRADWERRHPSERWKDVARYVEAGWSAARSDRLTAPKQPRSGDAA
jgi:hypothetical protein